MKSADASKMINIPNEFYVTVWKQHCSNQIKLIINCIEIEKEIEE